MTGSIQRRTVLLTTISRSPATRGWVEKVSVFRFVRWREYPETPAAAGIILK